ncbi:hypothetical protein DEU56DRAFT_915525 [Suillus clintonianus]|uniref:uncharacterized protein n=1 Tax=Suillus clintonianus TaxID=1904413 RepID=UPI001B86D930|nr:uncharacterized protein DEU56DRAFT_915525 [Suillus clintonianus]KAG2128262.1 hypothetical protein DEU56DRAFT_915525 [Suillus clintonianus]
MSTPTHDPHGYPKPMLLPNHNLSPDFAPETWNISSTQDSPPPLSSYISRPTSIQKLSAAMPVHTNLSDMSKTETSSHPSERVPNNAQRWRLNGSG